MSQKLTVIRVLIHRKVGELLRLPDIMEHRDRDQKVTIDRRIITCDEITDLCDGKCVFQKTAHETVVDCLGCRVPGKNLQELLVFNKKALQQSAQIRLLYGACIGKQFIVHDFPVLLGDRQIIRRNILARVCLADLLQGGLK